MSPRQSGTSFKLQIVAEKRPSSDTCIRSELNWSLIPAVGSVVIFEIIAAKEERRNRRPDA
jgi:hypothetical protein